MVRAPLRWRFAAVFCGALTCSAWAGPIEDAQRAYDEGDYSLAVNRYESAAQATPTLLDDQVFMSAWHKAQSRVAYATGSRLHAEGEFDVAVEQFMIAIAKDSGYKLAFAALEEAQRAGIRQHFHAAVQAADQGDLLSAKRRLERSLVLGGGADEQISSALASIVRPNSVFDEATLAQLAEAHRLGEDRQWGLAQRQLQSLVESAPLLLPARAELARAARVKAMSVTLTDEAAALITENRMSPALAKLVSATSVWPYNTRAAELLETVETTIKHALVLVEQARELKEKADWRAANLKVLEALAIDPSLAQARTLRNEIRVGLVQMLSEQALAELNEGNYVRARALIDNADAHWPNNRWTRKDYAAYQTKLGQAAAADKRFGQAYLRYELASRDASVSNELTTMHRALLRSAGATYAYNIDSSTPVLGVTSSNLADALATRAHGRGNSPASCIGLSIGDGPIDAADDPDDNAQARYLINIKITDTDIDLRQHNNATVAYFSNTFGNTGSISIGPTHYWEKYGHVDAAITLTDQATGNVIRRMNQHRWANYTDTQQYVIGQTWNNSYWTLPTDNAIASRLARDLAEQIHETIEEAVTLAKARALRDEAQALAEDDPAAALDKHVSAILLAGTVNARQARREIRRMANNHDEQHPHGHLQTPTQ